MKVAILHGVRDLRLEQFPVTEVGANDLLIKVAAAGICGTDRPAWKRFILTSAALLIDNSVHPLSSQ